MTTSSTSGVASSASTESPSRHPQVAAKTAAKKQPRLRRGMMMSLPLSLLQIMFLTRVSSIKNYWVILGEFRRDDGEIQIVKGLEVFREHFRNFADRYVLNGGAACDIDMTGAGLTFRATKDLDIVLYVEALDAEFVRAFWELVRAGGYQVQDKSTGEKQFYRFHKPTNANYPFMLELFARKPDVLQVADGSLSAILLDDDYYDFIHAGRQEIDGVPMVGAARHYNNQRLAGHVGTMHAMLFAAQGLSPTSTTPAKPLTACRIIARRGLCKHGHAA